MFELYSNPSNLFQVFEGITLIVLVLTFGYAAYHDVKTRLIDRKIWGPLLLVLSGLFLFRILVSTNPKTIVVLHITNALFGFLLGYVLYKSNFLGFADCIGFGLIGWYFATPVTILQQIHNTMILLSPPYAYLYLPILPIIGTASFIVVFGAVIHAILDDPILKIQKYGIFKGLYLVISTETVKAENITSKHGVALTNEMVENNSIREIIRLNRVLPNSNLLSTLVDWSDASTISGISLYQLEHVPSEIRDVEIINRDEVVEYVSELQNADTIYISRQYPFILYLLISIIIYSIIGDVFHIIITSV